MLPIVAGMIESFNFDTIRLFTNTERLVTIK